MNAGTKPTCFVVMGFGQKTDYASARTFDLDKTYRNIIKPAAEAAGFECVRADEIVHSGSLGLPSFERLLHADVVIADLSTANPQALYELGLRHALRPRTTIVIAERGFRSYPFDLNAVPIRQYEHLGSDIGFTEVVRFREELTAAIVASVTSAKTDSPVYTFLTGLEPPVVSRRPEATKSAAPAATSEQNALIKAAAEAQQRGDFVTARKLLETVRMQRKAEAPDRLEDPQLLRQLALVTYKSRQPSPLKALETARDLLSSLDPRTTLDPQTVGLWGSIHKQLMDVAEEPAVRGESLDEAIRAYERGFVIENDYYNGINLAYLLNARAVVSTDRNEAIADVVHANRVRRRVIEICERVQARLTSPEERYWVLATKAEAYFGLGDRAAAEAAQAEAGAVGHPERWMVSSTEQQLAQLAALLAHDPRHRP